MDRKEIRGGPLPQCNFAEFGGPFTEWTHLANVATLFPDQTLEFDPVACKIINVDEANEAVALSTVKGGRCRIRDEEGLRILNDGRWRQKEHIIAWKILPFYAARWPAASTRPRASAA